VPSGTDAAYSGTNAVPLGLGPCDKLSCIQSTHSGAEVASGCGAQLAPGSTQGSAQQLLPAWAAHSIARHLRAALGLHLFNFDLLLPCAQPDSSCLQLCVVDINYFPGYDKIPGWEAMMVDFLGGLLGSQGRGGEANGTQS
jgi:hypothetical protein